MYEANQKDNQEATKLRMDDIISAINEDFNEGLLCLRIDATKLLCEINDQINDVVSIIKNRA